MRGINENNIYLNSDIARHDSVPIMNVTLKNDNAAKRGKCYVNVSKIPINSNLPFISDVDNDKPANNLKTDNEAPPPTSSVRNKLNALLEYTCGLVDFLAVVDTKLDSSFSAGHLNVSGFRAPCRTDLSRGNEVLIVYLNKNNGIHSTISM